MVPKSLPNSSVYPKVNYFHKFKDHISLKNVKVELLKVISSLKTITCMHIQSQANKAITKDPRVKGLCNNACIFKFMP